MWDFLSYDDFKESDLFYFMLVIFVWNLVKNLPCDLAVYSIGNVAYCIAVN